MRSVASDECGPTISSPIPSTLLQRLAAGDERRQQHVAERPVLEEQRPQHLALDRDVAHRLRHDGGQEDGLAREQVRSRRGSPTRPCRTISLPAASRIADLALEDRDERVARVADPEEHVADLGRALLAVLGEGRAAAARGSLGRTVRQFRDHGCTFDPACDKRAGLDTPS